MGTVTSVALAPPAQSVYTRRGRRYRLPIKIETDGVCEEYQIRNALMSFVPWNSQFAGDGLALLTDYELNQSSETRDQWLCAAIFEYESPPQSEVHPEEVGLNSPPWVYPAVRTYSGVLRQKPAIRAYSVATDSSFRSGNPQFYTAVGAKTTDVSQAERKIILNTAGFPPDPLPVEDTPHRIIRFKKNYQSWNEAIIQDIPGRINNVPMVNIFGTQVYGAYSVKCLQADAEPKKEGRFLYYEADLVFEFNPDLWFIEIPNVGLVEKVWDEMDNLFQPVQFKHYREIKASEPQPLDLYGRRIRSEIKPQGPNPGIDAAMTTAHLIPKLSNFTDVFGFLPW